MRPEQFAQYSPDDVTNQAPPLENVNLVRGDQALLDAVAREGAAWVLPELDALGATLGDAAWFRAAEEANEFDPKLKNFDRFGRRIDEVEFHPSYHALMDLSMREGLHASPWASKKPGRFVARAAKYYLKHQVEQGTSCPITMTFAVAASLPANAELAETWMPRLLSETYDARSLPASEKRSVLFGMAMTERQGGSDVRANSSKAEPIAGRGNGQRYRIDGHKWFCSAPQSDALLVLAQTRGELSCFLVPRFLEDGRRNPVIVQRLKPKLGNRSNASSEIRLNQAEGWLLGEEGRGVATIIEMVRHTRLDCCIGGASLIRRAVSEALNHAAHRYTFGGLLLEQPLMQNVLADLCLESEAATALAMRLNRAYEEAAGGNEEAAHFARLATAVAKFQITRKETDVVREALECHGGNGFIEESPMPRLFRESPLNAIWEGSGNVQCLDALRAAQRSPETLDAVLRELKQATGHLPIYDLWLSGLSDMLGDAQTMEVRSRRIVESLALGLQASVLIRHGSAVVAEAFVRSRLGGEHGQAFGTLSEDVDFNGIISRSLPETCRR